MIISLRKALLLLAAFSAVQGILAGLSRMGWSLPAASLGQWHAALLIPCFLGAVISMERAVAYGALWALMAPLLAALAGGAIIFGVYEAAPLLALLSTSILLLVSVLIWRRQSGLHTAALVFAVMLLLFGNVLWWREGEILTAIPAWLSFLILTIAAERLELTRLLPRTRSAQTLFLLLAVAIGGGVIWMHLNAAGSYLWFAALTALSLWLLKFDIARKNIRLSGLPRFIAFCLLSGYGWLLIAGLTGLFCGWHPGFAANEIIVHSVTLGLIVMMIFAHALVIIPAAIRVRIPYSPCLYMPVILLQITLMIRVIAIPSSQPLLRDYAGMGHALAMVLFALTVVWLVLTTPAGLPGSRP